MLWPLLPKFDPRAKYTSSILFSENLSEEAILPTSDLFWSRLNPRVITSVPCDRDGGKISQRDRRRFLYL